MNQSETLNSKDTIEYSLSRKTIQRQKRNTFYVCFLCLCILLLLFYFALPAFQCKSIKLQGAVNFTAEDCTNLSGNSGYHPLLLLDKKKSRQKLLEGSQGFFLDCSYESNGFSGSLTVTEDFPHGRLSENGEPVYFLSGKTVDEMKDSASKLALKEERIDSIIQSIEKQSEKVPVIHLPEGCESDQKNITLALQPLSGFSYHVISNLSAIQYLNSSGDSTWNNVADVVLEKEGRYLLLASCLSDCFSLYFSESNFPEILVNSLYAETDLMEPIAYCYQDTKATIEVYSFTPYLQNGVLRFIKTPKKGA